MIIATRFATPMQFLACFLFASAVLGQLPTGVVDTQPPGDAPPSPAESRAKITVPNGFQVTLFAAEPDVHQPIAMEFDDRGRLWVVECFSYPGWQDVGQDRILIFEDANNDGKFDTRKVFADKLRNVSGLALGFGGVWICSAPELLFIPDRDLDDRPDGPPVVKLDGWNDDADGVEHNVFNGMKWGPDGWLYGGHGILDNSFVGIPGALPAERQKLNCGIWRYHPTREVFEVVARGTTNPWGIDFDETGQGFFTNSVIGHFWHIIPGARYKRMYGSHFNPYTYQLIGECADHFHWGAGRWQDTRGGVGIHGEAGGGHAHVGALIYQGGHWPKEYHGSLFTANLHGNRLNRDVLRQQGSGYVATHAADFMHGHDPWFRGIGIKCGPDGNVFVSDWTDLGECHDQDGTHRSSGRIYKVVYGDAKAVTSFDLGTAPSEELFGYIHHPNKWFWEHALRLLHERATAGEDLRSLVVAARTESVATTPVLKRLRLASLLALIGGADDTFVDRMLVEANPQLQSWAIRYLSQETQLTPSRVDHFVQLARQSDSLRVRLELSIALQRISLAERWALATAVLEHFPDVPDQNLLPMTWFGIEPLAGQDPQRFMQFAFVQPANPQLANMRQFIVRRLLAVEENPSARIDQVLELSRQLPESATRDILLGLESAMQGRRLAKPPKQWRGWLRQFQGNPSLRSPTLALGAKFGDPEAIELLQRVARDRAAETEERQQALEILAAEKISGMATLLRELLVDREMRVTAIKLLAEFPDHASASALISIFRRLDAREQAAAVDTLCASKPNVVALLDAVERRVIPVSAIKPTHAASINRMRDEQLRDKLVAVWGDVRNTAREAQQKIANWKAILSSKKMMKPDLHRGQQLFADHCGKCHKLFGEGGAIGPDLTGSDRRNLDYILHNVITPSAAVGKDYRVKTLVLRDGRMISGVIQNETPAVVELQTADKQVPIARSDIDSIVSTEMSLMPTGQFDVLTERQVRDLVGYLRSDPR